MKPSKKQMLSQKHLEQCRHPEIQALRPNTENSKDCVDTYR